jgi:polar amino acid transport system substrate-binding protein
MEIRAHTTNRGILFLLAGILLASSLVTPASADTLEEVRERGELVVGVKTDFPPFGSISADGENVGFDVDLGHAFAKALFDDENAVEFVSVTSGNRIPFLQSNKIDIIMASMTITDERAEVVDFSEPYFLSGSLLLVPEDSEISGVDELNGKTVAIIQGSVQDAFVEERAPDANRVKFGKVSEAVLALKTGRADAYVHDDIVILTVAQDNPDLKPVGEPFEPLPYGIAVRQGDDEFSGWMDEQFDKMRADGSFDALWEKHFGDIKDNLIKPDSAEQG